jgi:hypothetical protein
MILSMFFDDGDGEDEGSSANFNAGRCFLAVGKRRILHGSNDVILEA